ncbi:hypothetical protein N7513_007012 [Penicillium frequentans]|nr:hypothetical protein N7513_007012 [Penicillium glabrum]
MKKEQTRPKPDMQVYKIPHIPHATREGPRTASSCTGILNIPDVSIFASAESPVIWFTKVSGMPVASRPQAFLSPILFWTTTPPMTIRASIAMLRDKPEGSRRRRGVILGPRSLDGNDRCLEQKSSAASTDRLVADDLS